MEMRTLFFDTAAEVGVIALFDGKELVNSIEIINRPGSAEDLVQAIADFVDKPQDIELLALGVGPGSYTGMRKSATVAMSWAYALKIPLVTLSSLDLYVPDEKGPFVILMDAKRGKFFVRLGQMGDQITWESEPQLLTKEQLLPYLNEKRIVSSPHQNLAITSDRWGSGRINLETVAALCDEKAQKKEFDSQYPIRLLYLQDPYISRDL